MAHENQRTAAHENERRMTWDELVEVIHQKDAALAHQRTEIALLTPTSTDKPPTKPGWYWRVNDEIDEWEMVHVRADLAGRLYTESRDDDGTVVINLVLHGKRWSKEPIPMPVIEKEGDNADD